MSGDPNPFEVIGEIKAPPRIALGLPRLSYVGVLVGILLVSAGLYEWSGFVLHVVAGGLALLAALPIAIGRGRGIAVLSLVAVALLGVWDLGHWPINPFSSWRMFLRLSGPILLRTGLAAFGCLLLLLPPTRPR